VNTTTGEQWACKPGSVPPVLAVAVISLSDLPGGIGGQPDSAPCLVLLRAGFAKPAPHGAAGGLLPHLFTLAMQERLQPRALH